MTKIRLTRTEKRVRVAGMAASVSLHDLPGQFEKLSEDKSDSVPGKCSLFTVLVYTIIAVYFNKAHLIKTFWYLHAFKPMPLLVPCCSGANSRFVK